MEPGPQAGCRGAQTLLPRSRWRAVVSRLAGQSMHDRVRSNMARRASEKDKPGGGFNPLLLLLAPVVAIVLSGVTWFASLFAGVASLTAVSFAFALVAVLVISTQVAGFTVLAGFLAVSSLLLKVATIALPLGLVYTAIGGKWPEALPWDSQEPNKSPGDKNVEVVATSNQRRSVFDDWDSRFAVSGATSRSQRERIRFEDLSPFSPPTKMQAFIVQEQLDVSIDSDKSPLALYKEIAVELAQGRNKRT